MREFGADVVGPERRSPEYLQSILEKEIKKWAEFIKQNGVTPN
jgi:tripartite-type tricarboxylate transporter receptor subunit TctC